MINSIIDPIYSLNSVSSCSLVLIQSPLRFCLSLELLLESSFLTQRNRCDVFPARNYRLKLTLVQGLKGAIAAGFERLKCRRFPVVLKVFEDKA